MCLGQALLRPPLSPRDQEEDRRRDL
eukprot:SAG31_NODE_49036_length_157_cov_12.241379_1_plen_25_part_10